MNLSELQIKPELRGKWAALDLGVLMARRWYGRLLLAWCVPALLTYALCTLFFYDTPWLSLLIVWWLKPLYDRLPLLLLSRFLFNEPLQQQLRLKPLLSLYTFDLFSALTWRRLNLRRSFTLAITVLERQKGVVRAKRSQLLQQQCGNAASWLTLTLVHMEMLLSIGFVSLAAMFMPVTTDWAFLETLLEHPLIFEHAYNLIYLLAVCVVAPFYVASGFALYINRRIELEAWDLELIFRHSMSLREAVTTTGTQTPSSSVKALAVLCLCTTLLFMFPAGDAQAQAQTQIESSLSVPTPTDRFSSNDSRLDAKEEILSTLETPPFVIEKTVQRWEWKNRPDNDTDSSDLPDWLRNLEDLFGIADAMKEISLLFEILIWAGIGLLLFLLARSLLNNLNLNRSTYPTIKPATQTEKPELIMGMAITAESLPDDIEQAIGEALNNGQSRQALSLLYRYSLYQLVEHYQLPLQSSHTELECAHIAAAHLAAEPNQLFLTLTTLWQQQAYAHITPQAQQITQLCQAIKREFQA